MSVNNDNYIDISYEGKIKNKYSEEDVYNKIKKCIKSNQLWKCVKQANIISIDFNDGVSDTFVLEIKNNKFEGYCRVNNDESFGESTLVKLLNMLFSIKSVFTKIDIEDDFSICKSFLKNKKIKLNLVELTDDEMKEVKKIYNREHRDYKMFMLECLAYYLGLDTYRDLYFVSEVCDGKWYFSDKYTLYEEIKERVIETFLYETTEYKNMGRFYATEFYNKNNICEYQALNGISFDEVAFIRGILTSIAKDPHKGRSFGVRDANVQMFYFERVKQILDEQENDIFSQCVTIYKYFKTILSYTNFQYVGKDEIMKNNKKHKYITFTNGCEGTVEEAFIN